MDWAYFRMLIHEFLNKDTYIVPEEDPIIILDRKSDVCMANNGKFTKHTSHIYTKGKFCGKLWEMQNAQDWMVWGRSTIGINFN